MRSGREGPVELAGFAEALAGLSGVPPRKSSPPKSWEAVGGAGFGGGGRTLGLSVVLGLTGGVIISSPIRSKVCCCGFFTGAGAWLGVDPFRREEERSNLAFSWTIFNGCYNCD